MKLDTTHAKQDVEAMKKNLDVWQKLYDEDGDKQKRLQHFAGRGAAKCALVVFVPRINPGIQVVVDLSRLGVVG